MIGVQKRWILKPYNAFTTFEYKKKELYAPKFISINVLKIIFIYNTLF